MNKEWTTKLRLTATLVLGCGLASAVALAEVYKVVDAEGNVTYTDQAPADGSAPMVLPELSIVDTDYAEETPASDVPAGGPDAAQPDELTPGELRRMYKDFGITRPLQDETYWGTANTVVISWGSSASLQPGMRVRAFVDGKVQAESQDGMLALTLNRGEHKVYAELLDARGSKIITSATVTFFIKQQSVGMNAPKPAPHRRT